MAGEARRMRCFSCMEKLSDAEERCPRCGWDNRNRANGDDMLEQTVLKEQYLVGRALGRGGFGVTYMGFDLNLNHRVAIKEYFPSMSAYRYTDRVTVRPRTNSVNEYSQGLERAFREAQMVASLGHIPNIVQVYNVFQANGTVYIVMDYVDGTTLYRMVKQDGPMGWRQALKLLYPIMRVLEKVHARGVIHRDVSPDNIMLDEKTKETVLLDFGAAREADVVQTVILKPGFAPFEQYSKSEWKDGRTDEYALCATMYYLLTGQPPESADKRIVMEGVLKTPRMLGSDVPGNVEAVLLKGMSVRADDRYESVAALRSAFERAEKGEEREDRDDSGHTVALKEWEGRRVPETAPWEEEPASHRSGEAGDSAVRKEPPENRPMPGETGEDNKPDAPKKRGAVPGVVKGLLVLLIIIVGLNMLNAFNIISLENLAGRLPTQVAGILLPSEGMKRRGDQQADTAGTDAPDAGPAKEAADLSVRENTPTATAQASSSTPVIQTGEISDSWDEIIAAIDDGSARQRYAVGATKALDLGALGVIHMQLAGFDLDERTDGGKAATTWIAVELLPEAHVMNENGSTEGGWRDSDLRGYLQETVYKAIPYDVRERLVKVKKKQYNSYTFSYQETDDLIWIPDTHEVIGDNSLYYGLFKNSLGKPIKQRNGFASWWWLRSAFTNYTFYGVYSGGSYDFHTASSSGGVALGFCLGRPAAPNAERAEEVDSRSGNENATTETTQASSSTPVIQTGEISDSWDEIIAAIDDGSARQRYAVGATKALDLGALGVIHMQLAGFDLDERTDGGKAATTWIAVELLPEAHVMNKDGYNEGGWRDSELRAYLQDTVYKAVPDAVRDRLVQVTKTQHEYNEKSEQSTDDLIWIPDKDEVLGDDSLYYGLFRNSNENRIKRQNGFASWWWLRSATNDYYFYYVNSYGSSSYDYASYAGGVALGFCL